MVWIYLSSAATSMLGNAVATIVWPWLVLERTGNPAAAGLVAAAIAVPSLAVAFLGGHLIDTFGRKPMSIISDVISGLSIVGVILVDQAVGLTMAWFIALGIIGAVGDIPGMAARSALVGDVSRTSGRTVDFIAGLNQSIGGMAWLIGPAIAGFLMAALPIELVLWITAGCSLLAAGLTALLRLVPAENVDIDVPDLGALRSWAEVVRPAPIRLLAAITFVSAALVSPYLAVLMPAHFQLIDAPVQLGLAMSAYAVGMMASGFLIAAVGTARRRTIWAAAMVCYLAGFSLMAALQYPWLVIIGMAIAGLGGGLMGPLQMVLVTEIIPERLRGRAFSVFMAIGQFSAPIGLIAATGLLTQVSIYATAAVLAIAWAVISVWAITRGLTVLRPVAGLESTQ
ncbi:MAG: MFS transporter [Corynebacterium sp.]|uniref:MFS transporter n=1 Tax=Corynebacterium sp. TaxID=1720 RepID=UPI0026E0BDA4|nr:MFS transporter [Corynebacterium sp.]MDO5670028.1 MFS transporter [Corynebacterium sp.]